MSYFKFAHHSSQQVGDTKHNIYLKDVILALSWGARKVNACKNTSLTVSESIYSLMFSPLRQHKGGFVTIASTQGYLGMQRLFFKLLAIVFDRHESFYGGINVLVANIFLEIIENMCRVRQCENRYCGVFGICIPTNILHGLYLD